MARILYAQGNERLEKEIKMVGQLQKGFEIDRFGSTDEAVKKLKDPYDILLMYLGSPKFVPLEVMDANLALTKRVSTIAIYDKSQKKELQPLIDKGLSEYLENPVTASHISDSFANQIAIRALDDKIKSDVNSAFGYFKLKDYTSCMAILQNKKGLVEDGGYLSAYMLGACYYNQTVNDQAKFYLSKAIEKNCKYAPAFLLLKDLCLKEKNRKQWFYYWDKAVRSDLTRTEDVLEVVKEYVRQDQVTSAIEILSLVADSTPDNERIIMFLSLLLAGQGMFQDAVARLNPFIKTAENPLNALLLLTDCYLNLELQEESRSTISRLADYKDKEYEIEIRNGELLLLEKKTSAAEGSFNRALLSHPGDLRALRGVYICNFHSGKIEEAKKGFTAIWNNGQNDDVSAYFLAKINQSSSDKTDYYSYIAMAESLNPSKVLYKREIASYKIQYESLTSAKDYLDRILEVNSNDYELLLMSALVYQNMGDIQMALDLSSKAKTLVHNDWKTSFLYPALLMQLSPLKALNPKELNMLQESAKINPKHTLTFYFLALAHWLNRKPTNAFESLGVASRLSPNWDMTLKAKSKMDKEEELDETFWAVQFDINIAILG